MKRSTSLVLTLAATLLAGALAGPLRASRVFACTPIPTGTLVAPPKDGLPPNGSLFFGGMAVDAEKNFKVSIAGKAVRGSLTRIANENYGGLDYWRFTPDKPFAPGSILDVEIVQPPRKSIVKVTKTPDTTAPSHGKASVKWSALEKPDPDHPWNNGAGRAASLDLSISDDSGFAYALVSIGTNKLFFTGDGVYLGNEHHFMCTRQLSGWSGTAEIFDAAGNSGGKVEFTVPQP